MQLSQSQVHVRNSIVDIYRQGQVNNLIPDQSQPWVVNASLDYFGDLPDGAELTYTLMDSTGSHVSSGAMQDVNATDAAVTGMTTVPNGAVDLWWPSQLGSQTLYNMSLTLQAANKTLACVNKRVGFRTIVLNESPISDQQLAQGIAPGNNWHFEINGHEFYAKGSNFIPPDAFWPRVTYDRINSLFDSVIDGNQNMLRVWSSGAYSPDFMYARSPGGELFSVGLVLNTAAILQTLEVFETLLIICPFLQVRSRRREGHPLMERVRVRRRLVPSQ